MDIDLYFKGLNECSYLNLVLDDKPLAMMHLLSPMKRKPNNDFIIVLDGSFFARLESFLGVVFYELIKKLTEEKKYSIGKIALMEYSKPCVEFAMELLEEDREITDEVTTIVSLFEEIKRFTYRNHLKNEFKVISSKTYAMHSKRPYAISFLKGGFQDRTLMLNILDNLYKDGIISIDFDESFIESGEIINYLKYTDCFYSSVTIYKQLLYSKDILSLKQAGLHQAIFKVNSTHSEVEYQMSGRNLKDYVGMIKAFLHAKIKVVIETNVTTRNPNYLDMLEYFSNLGVNTFIVSFDSDILDADLIIKRANYYASMKGITIFLDSKVIKEKHLKLQHIIPIYYGRYTDRFYMENNPKLYLDKECSILLGNSNENTIRDCFLSKEAKKIRKEYSKKLK